MCKFCDPKKYLTEEVGETRPRYIRIEIENCFGMLRILAHGDNSDCYTPKYCPECGRRLTDESQI